MSNFFFITIRDVASPQHAKHLDAHLALNGALMESGYIVAAGGLLAKGALSSDADAFQKSKGGFMIVKAADEATVWEKLKVDPYYTSGEVWDTSSIDVTPIMLGWPKV